MNIRRDDTVKVISGNDRGAEGRVLQVDQDKDRIIVEGINTVMKHVHKSQRNPQGGRLQKEAPIPTCKVMLVCPSCNQATRVGKRKLADGTKVRFCKKCNADAGVLLPAKSSK